MEMFPIIFVFVTVILLVKTVKIVPQARVLVVERFGKFQKVAESGLNIIVPIMDNVRKSIDLRETFTDIPPQPVITKDNVTMQVDCVVYWQVTDAMKSVYEVDKVERGIELLTLSALRAIIGDMDLDDTLSGRDRVNTQMRTKLDMDTDKWGVKVTRVELRNIHPPPDIQQTMEKQMTAERTRRAAILTAEGEKQANILTAEGHKQRQILEAEGRAMAAIRVAEAEKESIRLVAEALKESAVNPGQYLIAVKYVEAMKEIAQNTNKTVFLPYEATGLMGSLGGIQELFKGMGGSGGAA